MALKDTFQDWTGTTWVRVERDMEADLKAVWPSETLAQVTGIGGNNFNATMWFDDLVFSNSLTVEHNVLQPGTIAHIARHRTIATGASPAAADTWFHCNHVGSVVAKSNSSGASTGLVHQDAFGNPLASITTGTWASSPSGWHHNTKEIDATTGLTYMYQRWYEGATASFLSASPLPVPIEPQFSFAFQHPTYVVDATGLNPFAGMLIGGSLGGAAGAAWGIGQGIGGCSGLALSTKDWADCICQSAATATIVGAAAGGMGGALIGSGGMGMAGGKLTVDLTGGTGIGSLGMGLGVGGLAVHGARTLCGPPPCSPPDPMLLKSRCQREALSNPPGSSARDAAARACDAISP